MYFIRRAKADDADTLLKLARMVHFVNLPPDKEIIGQKIVHSRNSFARAADRRAPVEPEPVAAAMHAIKTPEKSLTGLGRSTIKSDLFMFVLEDAESGGVLGTSQVIAKMGGPGNPNVSLKLDQRHFFSKSLQTGTTHTVARLHLDDSSPSELGGLILQPSYRRHKLKLGRFISLVRFHFIGLHRRLFSEQLLAEMMAAITADGQNLLWDYLGRRFVPLSYDEADRFCQYSREFILSLLPKEDIYLSLLPPQARALIGEVGPETVPARKMLESLGFGFHGFIDPFDGGPHLTAKTEEVPIIKQTERRELGTSITKAELDAAGDAARLVIVSYLQSDGDFFAVHERALIDAEGRVHLNGDIAHLLHADPGSTVGVTPTDDRGPLPHGKVARKHTAKPAARKAATRAPATKKAAKAARRKPRT